MHELRELARHRCFGGWNVTYEHASDACASDMRFAVYLPPQAESEKVPALYWLSGLTCTEENFMAKAGAQRYAAQWGVALIVPDTSPRNTGIEGENDDWDFGSGAGFYVDATEAPWSAHYRMYTYVTRELPSLVNRDLPIDPARKSISGHSMGGHGALVIALRNPEDYRSVSAFSPIAAPSQCPWGEKAFSYYLGGDRSQWQQWDTSRLVEKAAVRLPLLVDQGEQDEFLETQLKPQKLIEACAAHDYPLELRMRSGYDHSYYFVASFIGEHLRYHADALQG
ncbi:MAG TPA: S-formylglutathione hydrolase [Gammaproteobacteria bacterium]|nr:S-formylglutathione hydrolase [Gammaproteobacteria bacterium]